VVALVSESQDTQRHEPDFVRLKDMIDQGCINAGFVKRDDSGEPSYYALGKAIKKSTAIIYGIVDGSWPEYDTLLRLAAVFEQSPSIWLELGGFPPNALPPVWEKLLAEMRDKWDILTPDQRRGLWSKLNELDSNG